MGTRASSTATIAFDNCRVPRANLLGNPGDGLKILFASLNKSRPSIAAHALGIATLTSYGPFQAPASVQLLGMNIEAMEEAIQRAARARYGSENDIRGHVTRRKVSAGTRSDDGRDSRDAFLGLTKTCDKLGIPLWDYLGSRLKVAAHTAIDALDRYVRGRTQYALSAASPTLLPPLPVIR